MNVIELRQVLIIAKRWDVLIQKIRQCHSKHTLMKNVLQDTANVILYADMIVELEKERNNLIVQLNIDLISDDTTLFERQREEFFSNLMKLISALRQINSKLKDLLPFRLDIEKLEEELKKKVTRLGDQLLTIASKTDLSQQDSDKFRMYYNHLLSFDRHVRMSDFDVRHMLDMAEEKILDKHYNVMRGIEAARAYLLMPHVGQVIAIFRILGIGYNEHDDLMNNLVQIGTGEGKSVVMAVTACVFALIGVDVNCSCYSEALTSAWETKANNLRAFMNTIGPKGGMGAEAIEIGLWHAVKESEMPDSISQVILIGDAPANTESEVRQKRARFGEAYWEKTRFGKPTYYTHELQKLKSKNIPVHAFYLTRHAKDNFKQIANETRGRCERLNIHSLEGAESLTDFVTEEVLRKAAGDQGDAAVELYRKTYKTFTF
ncbi:unnamed protein product [Rotaria sordida]|uniref:Uncharacterized protein n=1 Tax=Rotaria sordida TaxID=392033 RepID=A0A815K0V2_9BILA|nr:unnamed protein product [Rotaria sordida]CAF1617134.1 unnamed protein product [Rotaria sordida]